MATILHSRRSRTPMSSQSVAHRRGKASVPLSTHGMPKTPYCPDGRIRAHRFLDHSSSSDWDLSGPMSPPMSARSFGTVIDSAPSTPAYSPRMGTEGDAVAPTILSLAPPTPREPEWDMPEGPSRKRSATLPSARQTAPSESHPSLQVPLPTVRPQTPVSLRAHRATSVPAPPPSPLPTPRVEVAEKEVVPHTEKQTEDPEPKEKSESTLYMPPLGKIATRVKSMFQRTSTKEKRRSSDSREEKRRKKNEELDYMEDVHWTEM
ncbi:hypothetical protein M011DRAFT_473843 [Sporormia fimetaria CBS 119925]|uniref:Uncharacterized protein n=1 Tax=Sporormia fimetaria CBS 119925 TaxID=1340428 RepID=A0A6A6VNP7_9PLEO|nr:hypothetical protein M011DRAFT_473843 [Sporormia fimetaria CBS 119925]